MSQTEPYAQALVRMIIESETEFRFKYEEAANEMQKEAIWKQWCETVCCYCIDTLRGMQEHLERLEKEIDEREQTR